MRDDCYLILKLLKLRLTEVKRLAVGHITCKETRSLIIKLKSMPIMFSLFFSVLKPLSPPLSVSLSLSLSLHSFGTFYIKMTGTLK